ncbi:hypothetical protein [Actinoplanes sp. NPDC026619]|uniref:hypothetical protein n=1 Tax=Actinoplanes sp. NPDC026619 TaxID=3155798 RepID=UPI0033F293F8
MAVVVCATIGQWDDVARFVIVFGVLLISRSAGLPRPFDAALGATLTVATVAMPAGWYETVPWVDLVIHGTTTGAVAVVVTVAMGRVRLLPLSQSRAPTVVLLVVALGFSVGVLWEFWEWLATHMFGLVMVVGYTDTIADLAMDGASSLLAGAALAAWLGSGRSMYRTERPARSVSRGDRNMREQGEATGQ